MTTHVYNDTAMLSGDEEDAFVKRIAESTIGPALLRQGWTRLSPTPKQFTFEFASALSAPEITTLDSIVANDGTLLQTDKTIGVRTFDRILDPTVNNDNTEGFIVGDQWVNTVNDESFACLDTTTAAASWQRTTIAGSVAATDEAVLTAQVGGSDHIAIPFQREFIIPGSIVTGADQALNFRPHGSAATGTILLIDAVKLDEQTAPAGGTTIVDINKNGTTIFTTQANRPTLTAPTLFVTSVAPDVTEFVRNDIITVDVDDDGTGAKGSDLQVILVGRQIIQS